VATATIDRHALREAAADVVGHALARPDAGALQWLRSPQWERMKSLRAEGALEDPRAREQFIAALPDAPPSPARIALVHRMERAGAVSALQVEVAEAVERIVERARGGTRPPRDREHWLAAAESTRFRTAAWTLYVYRNVSDEELGDYVAFWETPSGQWLVRVYRDAVLAALDAAEARVAGAVSARTDS
jgi:hypothetical protein